MLINKHRFLKASIIHRRPYPKNDFKYKAIYCLIDFKHINTPNNMIVSLSNPALICFLSADYGYQDGRSPALWAKKNFEEQGLNLNGLKLLTIPRVFGYAFNPVSFWLGFCDDNLVGCIADVNNTFGQKHCYVICKKDQGIISKEDWFEANKEFHVSPFFDRSGKYYFNLNWEPSEKKCSISIHYYCDQQLKLITCIQGKLHSLTTKKLAFSMLKNPLYPIKIIGLIHYQALKLYLKKVRYRQLPIQKKTVISQAILNEQYTNQFLNNTRHMND